MMNSRHPFYKFSKIKSAISFAILIAFGVAMMRVWPVITAPVWGKITLLVILALPAYLLSELIACAVVTVVWVGFLRLAFPSLPGMDTPLLLFAIQAGKRDIVKRLLEQGADPNVCEPTIQPHISSGAGLRRTALMVAVERGQPDIVTLLLDHGARIDYVGEYGWTALTWAITARKLEMVRLLLERGADINICGDDGDTPIFWPAGMGDEIMLIELLSYGADPNAVNKDGFTPLLEAISCHHVRVVEILLKSGADPHALTPDGKNTLQYAKERAQITGNSDEVVQILLRHLKSE